MHDLNTIIKLDLNLTTRLHLEQWIFPTVGTLLLGTESNIYNVVDKNHSIESHQFCQGFHKLKTKYSRKQSLSVEFHPTSMH